MGFCVWSLPDERFYNFFSICSFFLLILVKVLRHAVKNCIYNVQLIAFIVVINNVFCLCSECVYCRTD